MEKQDLIDILHGDVSRISKVNERDVALFDMEVIVYPEDVRRMLHLFLGGKVTSEDLTNWAGFVCVRAEYGPPNYFDEEMEDYYEDMFYVIQRLSTPEIDGEVNEKRVKLYLSEMNKYFK